MATPWPKARIKRQTAPGGVKRQLAADQEAFIPSSSRILPGPVRVARPRRTSQWSFASGEDVIQVLSSGRMKLHYYPETDSLCIELSDKPSTESEEVAAGVVIDSDSDGHVVGFDIDHASKLL